MDVREAIFRLREAQQPAESRGLVFIVKMRFDKPLQPPSSGCDGGSRLAMCRKLRSTLFDEMPAKSIITASDVKLLSSCLRSNHQIEKPGPSWAHPSPSDSRLKTPD
jgi:hypothetical protein